MTNRFLFLNNCRETRTYSREGARPFRVLKGSAIPPLLPVAQRSNPFSILHLRRLMSFERYHYNNSLDSKAILR